MVSRTLYVLFVLLAFAGCASRSPSASFFVLSPLVERGEAQPLGGIVGVGPVRLPDYLARSQLVRRGSDSSLVVDEFNRWGGDLTQNIQDVLAENLSRLLGSDRVVTYPWNTALGVTRQLTLDIRRFEAGPGDQVVLELQWRLLDSVDGRLLAIANERVVVPVAEGSPAAMVRAQSAALAELSRYLARELVKHGR
jgi:uncharacterized lipoprotein YmbA